MNEFRAKKLIEDIARRVAKEELATDDRAVNILRRRLESMEDSYAAIGGTVGDVQNQVNVIQNAPPEALNQNIGFMVDSDGDGVADHWSLGGTATAKTASLDTSKYVYGAKSQKLSILATNTVVGGTAYVKQTIPAEPNRVYCFSLYYCGDTVDALSYDCYIRKNHADATYTDVPLSLPLTANWERRWITTTAEENVTSIDIYVGIKANQAGVAVNAWFDLVIVNGGPFPMPVPGLIDGIIDEDHVDHVAPPNPTLDAANTIAGVELLGEWTLNYYVQVQWTPIQNPGDFKCYNVYFKETGATNWVLAQVVRNINANKAKFGGLKENTSYTVAITSEDIFGNEGTISATLERTTPADLPPGNVGTVNSNFAGMDCQLWWDEVTTNSDGSPAIDIKGYVVEVYRGAEKKRTEHVSSPYYNYTFEKNEADSLAPNPIFKIYAKDIKGQLSVTPATVQPVNLPPAAGAAPSAVAGFKVVVISCPRSAESDVRGLRVYHSLDNATYDLLGDAQGTFYVHKTDCTVPHYYKYKYLDAFGQESDYSPAAGPTDTTDGYIQPSDLAGALYQIVPSSNPAPLSGTLENLYDGDLATVATFDTAGYVQFDFPVEHVFNKVIVELDAPVQYYVNYYNGTTWVDICGTQAVPKQGVAGHNTEKFTRQIQTRQLRFNFLAGCTIKELKFSAYIVADEIDAGLINLAKGIQIYNNATGSGWRLTSEGALFENGYVTLIGAGGTLRIDSSGLVGMNFELTSEGFRLYSTDNKFQITPAGMFATDPADPTKMVKMDSRGLYLSRDGGTTWSTVITADGIEGSRIKANTIQANALSMNVTLPGDVDPAVDTVFPFDGPLTLVGTRDTRATFTRSSVAYRADGTQFAANQPRFEPGKFAQAVMVEEGTTNLAHDPNTDNAWWNAAPTSGIIWGLSNDWSATEQALKVRSYSGAHHGHSFYLDIQRDVYFTLRAKIKNVNNALYGAFYLALYNSAGTCIKTNYVPEILAQYNWTGHNTPDYTEAWITYRIPSGVYTDAVKYTVQLIGNGTSESEIYLKDIQLEQKPYKTTWHPYNSTRSLETLTIPTAGVLNPQEGTVEFIVIPKTPHVNPGGDPWWNDFTWGTPGTNGFLIRRGVDTGAVNRFQVELYGTAIGKVQLNYDATFQQDTPYHIAFRWNNAGCALLVDGIKRAATTYLYAAPSATEAQVGYRPNNRRADALIDSLRLSKRAYTDAEIAEHAAATTPPTEGGQSMNADLWPIRAVGQQIWLDSTGLYMKNASAPNIMMHLNSERLAFWDTSGMPSIGIGEVTDMAQQLGWPDNLYGLLIAQGLIVAHQGVLGDALTDYGTTRTKIEDGSIDRNKIEDYSITMTKIEPRSITIGTLSDTLSVTIPDRLQLFQSITGPNVLTNPGFETGNLTGWTASSTSYIVVNSTAKYEGTYGCQFKAYSDTLSLYQDYPASPNQRWLAQVRVYQSDYAGIYIKLRFLNSARSILSTTSKGSVTPGWCDIAAEAVAPANTAYVRFELYRNPVDGSDYYADDCKLCMAPTALTTSYQTVDTIVVPRTEAVEQLQLTASFRKSVAGANTITWSALINGQRKFETTPGTVTLDVRGISGDLTIEFQAKADVSPAKTSWVGASCYINQRLPLRGAAPRYSVTEVLQASCNMTCERACQTTCQLSCQASCQTSCQTTCQDTCQTACQATCQDVCQSSCQSTCELTTQGGGCFVEGTPVSVYDAETGEVTEIPIEALAPGMLMPAYDPNTDTVAVTECISNVRSKTGTLFVIEVEGGHVLRATGEQPFDVLRPNALTGEVRWQKLQARYLKPGDVMIRPFDEANRTPKVVSVTEIIVPATWVWNPHTASGRYIADGFADATKMLV